MAPNSIGFICHTYVTTDYDKVTVECIDSKKSEGQTNKQINKQTNQRRQKDYSRRATITNKQNDRQTNETKRLYVASPSRGWRL